MNSHVAFNDGWLPVESNVTHPPEVCHQSQVHHPLEVSQFSLPTILLPLRNACAKDILPRPGPHPRLYDTTRLRRCQIVLLGHCFWKLLPGSNLFHGSVLSDFRIVVVLYLHIRGHNNLCRRSGVPLNAHATILAGTKFTRQLDYLKTGCNSVCTSFFVSFVSYS